MDLRGQLPKNTYQNLVTTDGSLLYNGTGSQLSIGGSSLITGSTVPITSSFALTASFLSGSQVTASLFGTSSQAVSSSFAVSASWAPAAYSLALQQIGTVAYNSNTTYYFGGSQNVLNTTSPQNSYVDIPSAGTMTRVSYHINVTTTGSYAPDSCSLALILNNNNAAPFAYTTASFSSLNATHSFQNLVTSQSVNVGDTLYCRLMMCTYSGSLPTSDKAVVFCFIQ
jgi:hypothetical protein